MSDTDTPAIRGSWSAEQVSTFLGQAQVPVRLACAGPDGYPRVVSLWYRWQSQTLQCVTHRDSTLAQLLHGSARAGFEVATNEPPYYGARGFGDCQLQPLGDSDALHSLISRYLGDCDSRLARWLLSRADEELLITLQPRSIFSWDYRERMKDAVKPSNTAVRDGLR